MTTQWKEFTKRPGERISYEITATVLVRRTAYQLLEIYDGPSYGRMVFLDGKIQSAALDEFLYHEALVHPAMLIPSAPRRVYIAGGGEGATLREVLRHPTVTEVVMVDIDAEVVQAARQYLQAWHVGSFDDPRLRLIHADARAILAQESAPFDCIIIDVTDPLAGGPSYLLFTREFYELAASKLTPDGAIAVQAESVDLGVLGGHAAIHRTLKTIFPHVASCWNHVPSFGESWGYVVASRTQDPASWTPAEVEARLRQRGLQGLRYYDGLTHQTLFALPRPLREAIAAPGPIITDAQPLYVP